MANKLFESLKGRSTTLMPTVAPILNLNTPSFWNQVEQMKRSIPNPRAEVEKLLQSGQMTQSEFEQIAQVANQMMGCVSK